MMPIRLLLACSLLAVLLAACGDDDSPGEEVAGATPTEAEPAEPTATLSEPTEAAEPTATTAEPSTTTEPTEAPNEPEPMEYELVTRWGGPVIPQFPYDVALLDDGRFAVADLGRNEVQIFSVDGELETSWQVWRQSEGIGTQPFPPDRIASFPPNRIAYGNDSIYTATWFREILQRFDLEGNLIVEAEFRSRGAPVFDLEVDERGMVYAIVSRGRGGFSQPAPAYGVYVHDQDLNEVDRWITPTDLIPVAITSDDEGVVHVLLFRVVESENPTESQPAIIARIDPENYAQSDWDEAVELEVEGQFDGLAIDSQGRYVLVEESSPNTHDSDVTMVHIVNTDGSPVDSWQIEGQRVLGQAWATGMALDDDSIHIVDPANNRVLQLDFNGSVLSEISGVEPGLLAYPSSLAFGPDGNLYVGDPAIGAVQAFSTDGELVEVREFPARHVDPLTLGADIAVSENGDVEVVLPYSPAPEAWLRITPSGDVSNVQVDVTVDTESRFIFEPSSIAVGPDGLFYMTMDRTSPRVRSYTVSGETVADWPGEEDAGVNTALQIAAGPDGVYVLAFGEREDESIVMLHRVDDDDPEPIALFSPEAGDGSPDVIAGLPVDLAVGADGRFYLLDPRAGQVIVLNPDGAEFARWSVAEEGENRFQDIGVDAEGRIYLAYTISREIVVFRLVE